MKPERKKQLEQCISLLGLPSFRNLQLLDTALTHSSYANENKGQHVHFNERLEFLGDAILDLVIGEYLFMQYPEMTEGELSKARASVVSEMPLASVFGSYQIGNYMLMGRGEQLSGGRTRTSILADAFEAVVGALYIDHSYSAARIFILHQLKGYLDLVATGNYGKDYKTVFQEYIQRNGEQHIAYTLCREEGPDHDKTFYMEVTVNGAVLGEGKGKTKKDAEQHAACVALKKLGVIK